MTTPQKSKALLQKRILDSSRSTSQVEKMVRNILQINFELGRFETERRCWIFLLDGVGGEVQIGHVGCGEEWGGLTKVVL